MKKINLKIITIVGTRPEIIRLSRVISLLEKKVNHVLIHTGQNYDYELNKIFFEQLEIKSPDYNLEVNTSSLGNVLGDTIIKVEQVLLKELPDAVLILGDTNASISGIIAKRLKIPIYHMEAGNRSFDLEVPEEINRKIIDHVADFNLVYTEHSRRHLISEGIQHRRIYLTGSPMFEVLNHYDHHVKNSRIIEKLGLKKNKYFLFSFHREENVDKKDRLIKIIEVMNELVSIYKFPIIISTHPRTHFRMKDLNVKLNELLLFHKPFGFFDYIKLQKEALCTISDSGTISEESSILNFPAITIRNSMERPEALDSGSIILTGLNKDIIKGAIETVINDRKIKGYQSTLPVEYKVSNTSERVFKLILGTSHLSNKWSGIEN